MASGTSQASNAADGWFTQSNPAAKDQGKGPKHTNARYSTGQPNNQERTYSRNRYVFSEIQKVERAEQERREKGREFHSAGAAKAKARLPPAEKTSGTVRMVFRRTKKSRSAYHRLPIHRSIAIDRALVRIH